MSTSSSTRSAMYHGVDFWKIVAWVKDELAPRLNSFVRKLEDLAADCWQWRFSIGAPQPKGRRSRSTSAMSRSLRPLAGNFCGRPTGIRIRHDLLRFGLLHSHQRSSSDTNLPHGGGQLPKCSARGDPPFAVVRPRPVPRSRGPAALPQGGRATAGSDRQEHLNR